MAKKNYPFIGVYVDTHDPNIIRADMLDIHGNITKSAKAICNTHEEKFNFRKGCEIAFNRLFDDDYVHPSDIESQNHREKGEGFTQNTKFHVGDSVRVVDFGEHYAGYIHFIETYCPHFLSGFRNDGNFDADFNHNGATGIVVYSHINNYSGHKACGDGEMCYVVCFDEHNDDGSLVYGIYNDEGIEKL